MPAPYWDTNDEIELNRLLEKKKVYNAYKEKAALRNMVQKAVSRRALNDPSTSISVSVNTEYVRIFIGVKRGHLD